MSQHATVLETIGVISCVLLFCTAWVLVTLIRNRCRHRWERTGSAEWVLVKSGRGSRWDWKELRQPVMCKECGKLTWQRIG